MTLVDASRPRSSSVAKSAEYAAVERRQQVGFEACEVVLMGIPAAEGYGAESDARFDEPRRRGEQL